MAFYYGSIQYKNMVNFIADKIVGSDPSWVDLTAAGELEDGNTSWTGADTGTDWGVTHWTRRAMQTTRDGKVLYISVEEPWYNDERVMFKMMDATYCTTYRHYSTGFLFRVSNQWDNSVDHYHAGDYQSCFCSIFQTNSGNYVRRGNIEDVWIAYWTWVDEAAETAAGNGMVMMLRSDDVPETGWTQSAFFNIEHFDPGLKEYDDGFSDWWLMSFSNYWNCTTCHNDEEHHGYVLHPFSNAWPSHPRGIDSEPSEYHTGWTSFHSSSQRKVVKGVDGMMAPVRSGYDSGEGDSKVRFVKPVFHALADSNNSPQVQSEHFLRGVEAVGLVDGDILAVDGDTRTYLQLQKDSPDSTTDLCITIRYEE